MLLEDVIVPRIDASYAQGDSHTGRQMDPGFAIGLSLDEMSFYKPPGEEFAPLLSGHVVPTRWLVRRQALRR